MDTKKNTLDLMHQRYLQYKIAVIIIIFSYIIGVMIALLTNQISLLNTVQAVYLFFISVVVFIFGYLLLVKFNNKLNEIIREIEGL